MRVLLVAPSLGILGGQAVQADRLRMALSAERGLQVGFLPVNPVLPGPLRHLQRIKYIRTIVTSIAYLISLVATVRRYDIIHAFSASYWSFLLAPAPAILIGRVFRKKTLLNYRSGEAEDHLRRWPVIKPILRLCNAIVVPSGYLVGVFGKFGWRAHAIPNFVDLSRFTFRLRRPLQPRFLSNRNLEPMYNVGTILRAFRRIQDRYPDASLLVVGDGRDRAKLEVLARELSLENVAFMGQIPPADMPSYYDRSDIYLNSSEIDNMPTSLIEAFAAGTPVVSTDAGGIPWIVRHNQTGLLVSIGDDAAMATWALRLLDDPAFATQIVGSARAECASYEWESVRGEWRRLYEGLLGWRKPAATAKESATSRRAGS